MDISVTEFKQHCLEILRRVERTGETVSVTRRGRLVVRVQRAASGAPQLEHPWEQLRALGGSLKAAPGESVIGNGDFEAQR